jgi:hypothetical protein
MFLAMAVVCSSLEINSCTLVYNNQQTFMTVEACEKELEVVLPVLMSSGLAVVDYGCVKVPGELA